MLLGLVIIPFCTNFLVRTLAWRIVLAPKGFLSNFLQTIGLRELTDQAARHRTAVQIGVVYNYLPLMIFPLFVALRPPRSGAARGEQGPRRQPHQHVLPGDVAAGDAGRRGRPPARVHPARGRLHHRRRARRGQGQHGRRARGQSQFQTAQNKALGSAVAVVLIISILLVIAIAGIISLIVRTVLRRRRAVPARGFRRP